VEKELHASYDSILRDFRFEFSQGGAYTCIALILLGVGLDFSLYPDKLLLFAGVRVFFSFVIYGIIRAMETSWGNDRIQWLTFIWLLQPQIMISWFIGTTEGATSIYYSGLTLAMYASGIVLTFGIWQNIIFGCLSVLFYAIACSSYPNTFVLHGPFAVNALLLVMAAVLSAVYTYFNERARLMLFRLKAEVAQKNIELEETNKSLSDIKGHMLQQEKLVALGTLSAGLMHEISNPVNNCLMGIGSAKERPTIKSNSLMMECLMDVGEGLARIQKIISDLKIFAYRPSGDGTMNKPFLFTELIHTALRLAGHDIKAFKIVPDLPEDTLVCGDEGAIIGVLINLLENAARALRSANITAPTIQVSAVWQGDRLHVAVWDNGSGISPENLARVFEPFFTTRDVGQGLGLGLSISFGVIERHGGRLVAQSELGKWTRMSFDLPRG